MSLPVRTGDGRLGKNLWSAAKILREDLPRRVPRFFNMEHEKLWVYIALTMLGFNRVIGMESGAFSKDFLFEYMNLITSRSAVRICTTIRQYVNRHSKGVLYLVSCIRDTHFKFLRRHMDKGLPIFLMHCTILTQVSQ